MKQQLFYFIFIWCSVVGAYSQVGINTAEPTAMLDVNGTIRVRGIISGDDTIVGSTRSAKAISPKHKVLVVDTDGQIFFSNNVMKTTFIRGGNKSGNISLLSITGSLLGWNKIGFNDLYFDDNNEFNTETSEFVAKKTGIYAVYVQFETSSLLSASASGVGVLTRKKGTNNVTLEAEESFSNISVLNISVTPPTRKVFTLVYMDAGDALFFGSSGLSLSVQLKGGTNSYFTIFQIK